MTNQPTSRDPAEEIVPVASGDLRLAANQMCWPAQEALETAFIAACAEEGVAFDAGIRTTLLWSTASSTARSAA